MSALPRLSPEFLPSVPAGVRRPGYDRASLRAGIAHLGVGAFHRSHQAEYTDDLLEDRFDRWGIVGINIRPPALAHSLGAQGGLYTRLVREDGRSEARIVGSIVSVIDSQESAAPAVAVISSPDIDVVTMTVTEKGYCHRPSTGDLDLDHPDIVHDIANPEAPRSVPGILLRAIELRMTSHGGPLTLLSCDNIPSNGVILGKVVRALADRRGGPVPRWIERNVAFPGAMVDRIAPAVQESDRAFVAEEYGYRDDAVVVGEPFRQWVIEERFASRFPRWDRVGATYVEDVEPFEHLKMRVLNGAQTTLSYLGVFAGHEHTCDDMKDPLLVEFVRRMLTDETLPTLKPVPGIDAKAYVEQSLRRLRNTAIRHRNHQIATDGSQKIVQRILNPIRERIGRGQDVELLCISLAGWMAYLICGARRFGARWTADDPYAERVAGIAERIGDDAAALTDAILAIEAIFHPALRQSGTVRRHVTEGVRGFLAADPMAHLRHVCATFGDGQLKQRAQAG